MATVSISKKQVEKKGGMVILSLGEYQKLVAASVPNYYLTGKAAKDLDKLYEQSMREYREGKTIKAASLKEALAVSKRKSHAR